MWWAVLILMGLALAPAGHAANSVVRAVDMTVARGETNHVFIVLDSVGIENGVELSLCFWVKRSANMTFTVNFNGFEVFLPFFIPIYLSNFFKSV